jgi:hypothetical protein
MKHTLLFCFFFIVSLSLSAQTSSKFGQSEDLRIFPNPVVEYFKVGYTERVSKIIVTNVIGREVRRFDYSANEKYEIGDLPGGYYLIQMRDYKNKIVRTQRVSKR